MPTDPAAINRPPRIHTFDGSCHCGAIGFRFSSLCGPGSWRVRACQCSFCRAHGARTTSDPEGRVSFRIDDEAMLRRYRFGLRTADFLVCGRCGVYLAAVLTSPRGQFATLNVNTIRGAPAAKAEPASYDGETLEQRQARRERQWTPVVGAI